MKLDPRIKELCDRLTSPSSAQTKLSASELHELAEFIYSLEEPSGLIGARSERETVCANGNINCECLAEWLSNLPEEFQKASVMSFDGILMRTPKRIVAYRYKKGGSIGIALNPMGTHLPFDDSLEWVKVLS